MAQMMRAGLYRPVRVKTLRSQFKSDASGSDKVCYRNQYKAHKLI